MDTLWFRDKLKDKKLSQRGLAKLVELDPAAVSLMLRGQRKMTPHEAHQISVILGVPILEVMRRAGIDVTEDVRKAPIAAHVDSQGNVVSMPNGTHDMSSSPGDCPIGTYAVQVRAHTSVKDGWLLFVSPAQSDAASHLDQLCNCATKAGQQLLGVVRRGYKRDMQNLVLWPSNETIFDADLAWVSPVLWIKPT
jgi:hypothetical protein